MQHDKDHFAQKAGEYDGERVQNVQNIAKTILKEVRFSKEMDSLFQKKSWRTL